MFHRTTIVLTTFALFTTTPVFADDPTSTSAPIDKRQYNLFNPVPTELMRDMDVDRPDRTNAPTTIDAGHAQFEIGAFDYVYDRYKYLGANSRGDAFTFGEVSARIGVTDHFEFEMVVDPFDAVRLTDFNTHQSSRQQGFGDLLIGGKYNLIGDDQMDGAWAWGIAIQPLFKIPTARESIGNGHAEETLGFPFSINLPADFHVSIQTTIGAERNDTNTGNRLGWQNAISVDRNVIPNLDVYVEYWSHVSTARHRMAEQTIDVGALYALTPNLQLDTGLFFGLNRATADIEWTAGISIRY